MNATHSGACYCGAITIEAVGIPEAMGYCHCASCRAWSAGPINAFTLWKPENVLVTKGAELLGRVQRVANSERRWCTQCGGHVLTHHPVWGITDVYAATLPSVVFSPGVHVNYGETVLPMRDGLPKFKDFPAELGGSGALLPE